MNSSESQERDGPQEPVDTRFKGFQDTSSRNQHPRWRQRREEEITEEDTDEDGDTDSQRVRVQALKTSILKILEPSSRGTETDGTRSWDSTRMEIG